MENNIRFKVLFLASWYPSRIHPIAGIFIKRHAEAVSLYSDVAVLFVTADESLKDKTYDIEYSLENNIPTVRVYYKRFSKVKGVSKFINLYRYFKASYLGLKVIKENFGKPDLVHVNVTLPAGLAALALKFLKGFPYIVTEHSSSFLIKDDTGIFKKFLTRMIIKSAEGVTIVSKELQKAMIKYGLENKYFIIPNVVDIKINCVRSRIDNKRKKILHISLLYDKQKNISDILLVLNKIAYEKNRDDFEFHILGDGVDREKLQNLAKELGLLNKYVFFHGLKKPEEVYEFLKDADFLITNSNYETFSVATAEALVCGVPVIATRCGGPEDFVTEDCGILIEPRNREQLLQAILYMLDNSHKYDREKISQYAKSKFSYEVVGKQFYDIYKSIITIWPVGLCGHRIFIHPDWKVIDIGSGHNLHPRANVLLEKELEESIHRSGEKAKIPPGKTLVIGDATDMKFFKDKEFDYAIASHIAEHIENIEAFLKELQRVARRGYIETPGPLSEFFLNEPYHLWIVYKKGDTLVFKKKKRFKSFSELFYKIFYLNENRYGHETLKSNNLILKLMKTFFNRIWKYVPYTYTKYEWDGEIKYKIKE